MDGKILGDVARMRPLPRGVAGWLTSGPAVGGAPVGSGPKTARTGRVRPSTPEYARLGPSRPDRARVGLIRPERGLPSASVPPIWVQTAQLVAFGRKNCVKTQREAPNAPKNRHFDARRLLFTGCGAAGDDGPKAVLSPQPAARSWPPAAHPVVPDRSVPKVLRVPEGLSSLRRGASWR